jgi:hypothetical protein
MLERRLRHGHAPPHASCELPVRALCRVLAHCAGDVRTLCAAACVARAWREARRPRRCCGACWTRRWRRRLTVPRLRRLLASGVLQALHVRAAVSRPARLDVAPGAACGATQQRQAWRAPLLQPVRAAGPALRAVRPVRLRQVRHVRHGGARGRPQGPLRPRAAAQLRAPRSATSARRTMTPA